MDVSSEEYRKSMEKEIDKLREKQSFLKKQEDELKQIIKDKEENTDYIVITTVNSLPIGVLRSDNEEDADDVYKEYKSKGYGVIKAKVLKASEYYIVNDN